MNYKFDYNKGELIREVASVTNLPYLLTNEMRLFEGTCKIKMLDAPTKHITAFLICNIIKKFVDTRSYIDCLLKDCSHDNMLSLYRTPEAIVMNNYRIMRSIKLSPINLLNVNCYDILDKNSSCAYIDHYIDSYVHDLCNLVNNEIEVIQRMTGKKVTAVIFDKVVNPANIHHTSTLNVCGTLPTQHINYILTNQHYFLDENSKFIKLRDT